MGTWHAQYTGPQGGCDLIIWHRFRGAFKPLGTLIEVYNRYMQMFTGSDMLLTAKIIANLHLHAFIHPTWSPSTTNLVVSLNYSDNCDSNNMSTRFQTVQPSQFEPYELFVPSCTWTPVPNRISWIYTQDIVWRTDSYEFVLILHIFVQIHSKCDNIIKDLKPFAFTQMYNCLNKAFLFSKKVEVLVSTSLVLQ